MQTNPNFKKRFYYISNRYMKLILKTRKLKAIKEIVVDVNPELNCYKNFVMESFQTYDVHNLSLKVYYSLLPSAFLKRPKLLNQALMELNQDGYIYLRKNLLHHYYLVDNQKTWIDLTCGQTINPDMTDLIPSDLMLGQETGEDYKLFHDIDEDTLLLINPEENDQNQPQFIDSSITTKYLTIAQIEALEKMEVVANLLANVFAKECLECEKLTSVQKATLKEIIEYNNWVIKTKQQQFEKQVSPDNLTKKKRLNKSIQQSIRLDIKNSLIDSQTCLSKNNYFDESFNKVINQESKRIFTELGWKEIRKLVINDYPDLFTFLGNLLSQSVNKQKSKIALKPKLKKNQNEMVQ